MVPLLQQIEIDRHATITAQLLQPEEPRGLIFLAHGATENMDCPFLQNITVEYYQQKLATVIFNFPFAELARRSPDTVNRLDLSFQKVIEHFRRYQILDHLPVFLAGKSMGARVAARVSRLFTDALGCVFFAYPFHSAARPETAKFETLAQVGVSSLFISGDRDLLAHPDVVKKAINMMKPKPDLHWIENVDHSLSALVPADDPFAYGLDTAFKLSYGWMDKMIINRPIKASRRKKRRV